MPTSAEQKALIFLAGVALVGGAVRLLASDDPTAPTQVEAHALAAQIAATDSAALAIRSEKPKKSARKSTRSRADSISRPPGPVDLDRASAEEIDRLPGVGPTLAERIVADRAARGAFGSLAALDDVNGVGPTLIRRLAPHVTFSGPARPSPANVPPVGASRSGRIVGLIGGPP